MLDIIHNWQTLIGGVLGGVFALGAALIVAWHTERRQDLSSAMLVVSTLVSVNAASKTLQQLFEEENAEEHEWPVWLAHKLLWRHPPIGASFKVSAVRIYPLSSPMAAHIDLFQAAYEDVVNRIDKLTEYVENIGEGEPNEDQKKHVQSMSSVIDRSFSVAAKHADCGECLIADLVLSKWRHFYRLRLRFWPTPDQKRCLRVLGGR